jgi:hypothetical protein
MSNFDDEMTAMDAVIFKEFGDAGVYTYQHPTNGPQLIDTTVIVDEDVEPYQDGYAEHYRQVLIATIPNPQVPVSGKNSLNITAGKYTGIYSIVKVISINPSEVVVHIK